MHADDEQRLLHILRAAQGDPALLALVPLDLTFAGASQTERDRLRTALIAAAVPHWFDLSFLAALLATNADEACDLLSKLHRLTNVESFPARGEDTFNVHEASRLALREYLRLKHPDLWQLYAQRACSHLAAGKETHERIERLYHLFAFDSDAAVSACEALDREFRQNPATCAALCLALSELKVEGWLTGATLVEALRAPLWYRSSRGEVSQLEAEARALLDLAKSHAHSSRVSDAYLLLGDVQVALGKVAKALDFFAEAKTIAERLAASDPANAKWQRDLSVSLNQLGNLAVAQGDLAGALRCFSEDKAIAERLAASDPANAEWQRDLSVSLEKLGNLAVAQGDLAGALRCFSEAKTIAERLAASDPANAAWQRDLLVSQIKLGELAGAQGDLARALRCFSEAKTISECLAASDPANAEWQRNLSVSLEHLGNLAVAQGDLAGALRCFSESKTIRERLAASDPANATWQRDLWVSYWKLANHCEKSQQPEEAKEWWQRAYETLAAMKERGLHVSPQDLGFLERLRAKVGGAET